MKKILIVIPNIQLKAGTERAVTNLANMLRELGNYEVTLISFFSHDDKSPAFELNRTIPVINGNRVLSSHFIIRLIQYRINYRILKKLVKNEHFDVVIGTEYNINYYLRHLSAITKTIGCEHFPYIAGGLHHNILRKLYYPKLNSIVLLTQKAMENYPFLNRKFVIPNSLPFDPQVIGKYENKTFLAFGRFSFEKNFEAMIKAFSIIHNELPEWKLIIHGSGPQKEILLHLIHDLKLESSCFIKDPVTDVQAVYGNSSIYLMTSLFEGLPMVLLECQSCGLPVVSFNCPEGPSDVIQDGHNGFLIEPGNINQFAEKAIFLARSEERWCRMQSSSLDNSKRFSREKIFQLWQEIIEEV